MHHIAAQRRPAPLANKVSRQACSDVRDQGALKGPVQQLAGLQEAAARHARLSPAGQVLQLASLRTDKLNVAGETHDESGPRRDREKQVSLQKTGSDKYWQEGAFLNAVGDGPADPYDLRYAHILQFGLTLNFGRLRALAGAETLKAFCYGDLTPVTTLRSALDLFYVDDLLHYATQIGDDNRVVLADALVRTRDTVHATSDHLHGLVTVLVAANTGEVENPLAGFVMSEGDVPAPETIQQLDLNTLEQAVMQDAGIAADLATLKAGFASIEALLARADATYGISGRDLSKERSVAMHAAASADRTQRGVWKIGDEHARDLSALKYIFKNYNLLSRAEFNQEMS